MNVIPKYISYIVENTLTSVMIALIYQRYNSLHFSDDSFFLKLQKARQHGQAFTVIPNNCLHHSAMHHAMPLDLSTSYRRR